MVRNLRDLRHAKILVTVGLLGSAVSSVAVGRRILVGEVINHLRVKLLNGLGLATAGIAAGIAVGTLAGSTSGAGTATGVSGGLSAGSGLGLRLLDDALGERLGGGNSGGKRSIEDNLNLHGTTINEETVELAGGLGGGIGLGKDDRSDATAAAVLVVGDNHLLDRTSRLGEVFL